MSGQKLTFYVGSKVDLSYRVKSWPIISDQRLTFCRVELTFILPFSFCAFHDNDFLAVVLLELAMFLHWWQGSHDNKYVIDKP